MSPKKIKIKIKMTIIGIEGGIGSGKTLSLVTLALIDIKKKEKVYSNIKLMRLDKADNKKVVYLTRKLIENIFELIKTKKFKMANSLVLLQEVHNYLDSRNSMSVKNRTMSYWILQSRHTGRGSCDILYDTQDFCQVDKRLRSNTDYFMRPFITETDDKNRPKTIHLMIFSKLLHRYVKSSYIICVSNYIDKYDSHEIVEF